MTDTWTTGLPERIELTVGEVAQLPLAAAAGGYDWTATPSDGTIVAVQVQYGPPPEHGAEPSSEPAATSLVLEGLAAGGTDVALRLARPWDGGAPLASVDLPVTVR